MAKILIVDDSAFMRAIVKDVLKKAGFKRFVEGESGSEAVKLYKKERPDIVLLDIVMEDDGMGALKDIMKFDPSAKVIIVSATGQSKVIDDAMRAGARQYLVKPFDQAKVVQAVRNLLK